MNRRRTGPLLVWLLALPLLGACGEPLLSLKPGVRAFTPEDYEAVYEKWTRSDDAFAFGQMRTVLHVTATFQSWEFRWAYVVRYARDMHIEPELRENLLRASLADAREHHRFFVTLAGERFEESDLTGEQPAWRVLLVDEDGRVTEPTHVERIRKPGPAERAYYPSVTPFRQAFRLAFPVRRDDGTPTIAPDARRVVLRFTGPLGRVDLVWRLRPER